METSLSLLHLDSSSSTASPSLIYDTSSSPHAVDLAFAEMASPDAHTLNAYAFLKLEDLHSPADASTSPSSDAMLSTSIPPPVVVHSRPAKKRKSWGQTLPEPTTTLPPRKRAKTDDEKEQRRIERIKRNRAAAHNSRERKRHETETLAVALARANAELDAYRRLHGPLPSSIVLPEVTLSTEDEPSTPVPSLDHSRASLDASSPASSHASLATDINVKCEPVDHLAFPADLEPAFTGLDVKPDYASASAIPLDQTQHSAVSVERLVSGAYSSSGNNLGNYNFLLDNNLSLPHESTGHDFLQDFTHGAMDHFAFAHGALDVTSDSSNNSDDLTSTSTNNSNFEPQLDFSFEDLIHDAATVGPVEHGVGAA